MPKINSAQAAVQASKQQNSNGSKSSVGVSTGVKIGRDTGTKVATTNQQIQIGKPKTNTVKYTLDNGKSGLATKTWNRGITIQDRGTYIDKNGEKKRAYTSTRDSQYITDGYRKRLYDYLNSGSSDINTTREFRNEAVFELNQAYDPKEKEWWENTLRYLDATVYNEYKGKIDRITASLEGYNTNLTNATNEFRSTQDLLGYQTDSNSAEYKNLFGKNQTAASKMKTAQGQVARANAMKTQLEDEMAGYFMDRDTWEARQRLKDMNLSRDNYREIVMAEHPEFAASPDAVEDAIDQLQKADQDRIDARMSSLGTETRLYNNRDKITESIGRFSANRITEIAGAASTVAKAMDEHITVNGDPILGLSGPPEKKTKLGEAVELIDDVAQKGTIYAGDAYRKITRDMSKFGKGAFDLADQTAEMAWDIGAGYLLGVDPKLIMGERVFGSEGTKASMDGATGSQAFKYAITKAGIEYASESLFGAFDKFTRGKGLQVTQDMTERIVKALADTPAGRTTLRVFLNGGEEQLEEFFSAMLSPLADKIYKDESFSELFQNNMEDVGYSMLMAGILGSLGGAANIAENRKANMELYRSEFDTDISARNDILNEASQAINAPLASVKGIMDSGKSVRQGAEENAQAKLAEQEKKDSSITKAFQKYQQGEDLNRSEISMLYAAGVIDKSQRDAMRQLEKADRLIAKSAAKTNQRREFFIQQAQDNGVRTRAEKNSAPAFEGETRLANDEIEHNQANPPESAVMAPQSAPVSEGTDIATAPVESVKPTAEPLTRDESSKAIENHEADNKKLASVVPIVDAAVSAEKPVHQINGNLFAKTGQEGEPPLSKKVWNWLQQFFVKGEGPNIYSNKLKADVIINERGLKNDVSHHLGETKAATFEAIPYVIKNGMTVSKTTDGNGKVRSIVVAGKVYLNNKNGKNGVPVNVYCLLKADDAGQNRFYLHEVSDGKGNLYYQLSNAEKDASTALRDSTPQMQGSAEETSSVQSVPQTEAESKPAQQPESKSLPPIESRSTELTNLINRLSYSDADEIGPLVSLAKNDFDSLAKAYNELTGMELPETGYESALRQLAADYSGLAVDEAADGIMADNEPLPAQQGSGTSQSEPIQRAEKPVSENTQMPQSISRPDNRSKANEDNLADNEPLPSKANIEETSEPVSDMEALKDSVEQRPVPPGTRKTHQNAQESKQVKGAQAEHEERMKDLSEKYGIDDGTFLSLKREDVSRVANYWIEKYGMQEEWNRLMGEKNWSRVDFSEAGKIVYEMTIQLNRDMTNGSSGLGPVLERKPGESNKEYFERQKQSDKDAYLARREPIDAMLQMYAQQKSEAGQKLQEQHKFTIADEIRMRASQRFLSYTEDGEVNNASDLAKNAKMWNIIDDLLTRAEKADTSGSKDAMMDVTKLVSRIRGRETMWGRLGMKEESRMLKDLYNGGFDSDAMASLMYGGISKIIDDLTPMTYADVIQTVRMNNMLSSPATALNNFLNNANALRVGSIAQNAAYPFAKVFEALTGKKVAFTDTSFTRIGKGKMRAEKMAMEYALLSAYYGMDGERGRFDPKDSNTGFWLNGSGASGVAGRALARYNFLVNAMVLSPDAPAKARANLGMKEGIERAFAGEEMTPEKARNKKELEAFADVETKRRALQDDNGATRAVLWAKNQINKAHTPGGKTVVKGRQLGELRLGDFAIAFAKVPANVGLQKVMATPYGAAFQMGRYAAGLIEAANNPEGMDTIKMAKLSRDIGRAFTTWGMIGLGALGAMTGALKNFDDTDDDEEKKLAAEKGYNGLTFNVSALLRRGSEWKDGDLVVSGNFLEILALPLTIGAFMYDAQQEGMGTFKAINYGMKESFTHLVDAVMEIPGLQQVGQLWESYAANKNTGASDYERAMKSLGQFVANSSTSYLIPNLVAQTAAGLDNKQRDIYNTTAYGESLKNIWMAKIPGLREKLPEKTDTFGNTRTYGDNSIMAMVNTVLLPGDIKKYHVSELEKELLRLKKETGYNGTLFDTKAQRKIEAGNGEVEYTLNPDQQRAFHMAKAKYLVEAFDKFCTSDEYKNLTDDQRLDVLKMLRMDAERMVKNECLEEAGVEDRIRFDKWEETLTSWDDKIQYLSAKQVASSLWDDENNAVADFEGMDKFMQGDYKKLTPEMKELITNSLGYLDDIEAASKYKLTSEQWQTGHDIYRYYVDKIDASKTDDEKVTLAQESQMWADIQKATGATDHQMEYFEGDMKLWFQNTPNANQYYEYLKDAGMTRQEAANTIKTISDLKPQPGYEESDYIQASQRYIAICDTVPKDKQWAAFWTIVPSNAAKKKVAMMHDLQAQGISLRTALSTSGMGEIRGRTEIAPGKWKYYTISK